MGQTMTVEWRPHFSHWGAFEAAVEHGAVVDVRPFVGDPDPSPILKNISGSIRHRARVEQPMVRAGWLDRGPGPDTRRGAEPFVPVTWDTAIDLLAAELQRIREEHGPAAIYGGSYGWSSAGRFHHAQSQVHRFLNCLGGYVRSVNTYSLGASAVILPHVVGNARDLVDRTTSWPVIVEHTDLIVCFGGIPLKNAAVNSGGLTKHQVRGHLEAAAARGVEFVLLSPVRDDLPDFLEVDWHPLAPGTDVALMLGLAHALITDGLHDRAFLSRYCEGFEKFERYVLGLDDGCPKSPEWAAVVSQIPAEIITQLARRMASGRTLVTMSWSLQRGDHGEQPPWMGLTLAALLGQIGLPGGGFGFGYGSTAAIGRAPLPVGPPTLPQGKNGVEAFIPVARIADMLLHPGEPFAYDGQRLTYPDVRLVYWCGGNPFHHHQDLSRLRRALARTETIVVHDPFWTAMARHADVVLPSTLTLERNDIGGAPNDPYLVAMHQAVEPFGQARNDHAIFADLAAALGIAHAFTEGRSEMEWLEYLYAGWRGAMIAQGVKAPEFGEFWQTGYLELPLAADDVVVFEAFRADPAVSPLNTPSGRIEIFSAVIDHFGYDDCPGHPMWLEPAEWLGAPLAQRFPLHLVANNPRTRLHSQLDVGAYSQAAKVQGREPVRLHPADAAARGIADGDVVRLFNDRGSCLAGAVISEIVRPGVVQLSTGAWYDPIDPADVNAMCVHGNPNVLTRDAGTSKLAQGCTGQHALVEAERWTGEVPPIRAHDPPATESRGR
ncbi:MAG: molybdopterin guanine dinucleotide-containing S/N-oxide reductase [Thermomicrobiales bacterium]